MDARGMGFFPLFGVSVCVCAYDYLVILMVSLENLH